MPALKSNPPLPAFELVTGAIGAVCLGFGVAAHVMPAAVAFVPPLREPVVATALTAMGAIVLAFALGLALVRMRTKSTAGQNR